MCHLTTKTSQPNRTLSILHGYKLQSIWEVNAILEDIWVAFVSLLSSSSSGPSIQASKPSILAS